MYLLIVTFVALLTSAVIQNAGTIAAGAAAWWGLKHPHSIGGFFRDVRESISIALDEASKREHGPEATALNRRLMESSAKLLAELQDLGEQLVVERDALQLDLAKSTAPFISTAAFQAHLRQVQQRTPVEEQLLTIAEGRDFIRSNQVSFETAVFSDGVVTDVVELKRKILEEFSRANQKLATIRETRMTLANPALWHMPPESPRQVPMYGREDDAPRPAWPVRREQDVQRIPDGPGYGSRFGQDTGRVEAYARVSPQRCYNPPPPIVVHWSLRTSAGAHNYRVACRDEGGTSRDFRDPMNPAYWVVRCVC